jgi:hypothetical protein
VVALRRPTLVDLSRVTFLPGIGLRVQNDRG